MLTAYDVLKKSGAGRDYPTNLFCPLIAQVEQEFVRECLGQNLWDYLKENLVAVPENITVWDGCEVYSEGDAVDYNGAVFISLLDNNNVTPDTEATTEWELFQKFTTDGANLIWETYISFILSYRVYERTITQNTLRSSAGGIVINSGDNSGFRTANMGEMNAVKSALRDNAALVTTNLVEWLNNNATAYGLPLANACSGGNCVTKGRFSRRWNFRGMPPMINTDW